MALEIRVAKITNVYSYPTSTSGIRSIGALLDVDRGDPYVLDLFENESIPMNFEVADVSDPSRKRTPYSKTFLVPGTKRNAMVFGYGYMMSTDVPFQDYVPQITNSTWSLTAQEAQIYVDGVIAFTGKLNLISANISNGEVNSFEVNFYANTINIFDEIENKFLTQLPFDYPDLNNLEGVKHAMQNTDSDTSFIWGATSGASYSGWTMAYPDWGFGATGASGSQTVDWGSADTGYFYSLGATAPSDPRNCSLRAGYNLLPYMYVKALIDKIFDASNFEYSSTFFESAEFRRLLLLYYDKNQIASNSFLKVFGYNPSSTTFYTDHIDGGANPDKIVEVIGNLESTGTVPGTSPFDANEILEDPNGIWDPDTQTFNFPRKGTFTIRLKFMLIIRFGWDQLVGGQGGNCPGPTPNANNYNHVVYPLLGTDSRIYMYNAARNVTVFRDISGNTLPRLTQALSSPSTYIKLGNTHYQWEQSFNGYSVATNFTITTLGPETWDLRFYCDASLYKSAPVLTGCNPFPVNERLYEEAIDILVEDVSTLYPQWQQTVPPITQKDFLSYLVKHMNLYMEVYPNSRTLSIEPRDTFYGGGTIQDWTTKVNDLESRSIKRFDPPKQVDMRMNKTSNWLDLAAQALSNDEFEYGSQRVLFDQGVSNQQIRSDFASTTPFWNKSAQGITYNYVQVTNSGQTFCVPQLALYARTQATQGEKKLTETSDYYLAFNNGLYTNPKMAVTGSSVYLHMGGITSTDTLKSAADVRATQILSPWSAIQPTSTPAWDINFKSTPATCFAAGTVPNCITIQENSYEKFFENFYLNLQSQKIFTCKVRLDVYDIGNFSFRNPIWITFPNGDGDYFIISKVTYDPTNPGWGSAELLTFNREYFQVNYQDVSGNPEIPYPFEPQTPSE